MLLLLLLLLLFLERAITAMLSNKLGVSDDWTATGGGLVDVAGS
jgi:hypothetical protein